jgi:two-component system sensor histidine kinase PhoQ
LRERLDAHVYTLLATAMADDRGRMRLPATLSAPAFNVPDSGLYAEIIGEQGTYRWRSASLIGGKTDLAVPMRPGDSKFGIDHGLAVLHFGISWEDDAGKEIPYTLSVASETSTVRAEQSAFRNTLWTWLGGLALLLLTIQFLLVRWGLQPLRMMSAAVQRIERGESTGIEGPVPTELRGLSENLNALIRHNDSRQQRIRNSLADLAHSMKTPLAVLRGSVENAAQDAVRQAVLEQTERIDQIVRYQRHRAAVAGGGSVSRRVALTAIVQRLLLSLDKVHQHRGIKSRIGGSDQAWLRADEGDMLELFGNLLENAYRFADTLVAVEIEDSMDRVTVSIADDGPGLPDGEIDRLMQRGQRADSQHPGEGIGLAVVDEIIGQYRGSLHIERSRLGGAGFRVSLPT